MPRTLTRKATASEALMVLLDANPKARERFSNLSSEAQQEIVADGPDEWTKLIALWEGNKKASAQACADLAYIEATAAIH
jgi:hypothetical protein